MTAELSGRPSSRWCRLCAANFNRYYEAFGEQPTLIDATVVVATTTEGLATSQMALQCRRQRNERAMLRGPRGLALRSPLATTTGVGAEPLEGTQREGRWALPAGLAVPFDVSMTVLAVVVAAWLIVGAAVGVVGARHGHWRWAWVVSAIFGPFAIPLALQRHAAMADPVVLARGRPRTAVGSTCSSVSMVRATRLRRASSGSGCSARAFAG